MARRRRRQRQEEEEEDRIINRVRVLVITDEEDFKIINAFVVTKEVSGGWYLKDFASSIRECIEMWHDTEDLKVPDTDVYKDPEPIALPPPPKGVIAKLEAKADAVLSVFGRLSRRK